MNVIHLKKTRAYSSLRWFYLAIILLPTLLISLNTYMIQIALPIMQSELHINFSQAQLIFSGYSIGLASALIIGGKLGDVYGRRKMLVIGVFVFTVTAFVGGISSHPLFLIIIRIVQGLSAAFIQPQILSIIQIIFPSKEKNLAFGLYGAVIGIAFTFGLILGGVLVGWNLFNSSWRIIFLCNVPFGILVLLLLPIIPESRGQQSQHIDWTGTILLMISILLVIYPLSEVQKYGWNSSNLSIFILSFLVFIYFILIERHKQKNDQLPLIDLSVFKNWLFVIGISSVLTIYMSMFSFFFILNYFLHFGLHYHTTDMSLIFLPIGLGFFITSISSSKIVNRFGLIVLKIGALIMSICTFILARLLLIDAHNLFTVEYILLLFVYGLGLGFATTPLTNTILSNISHNYVGVASGLFTTFMYLANSLAVVGISIIFSNSLKTTLEKAPFTDYVHAFSNCLFVISILSLSTFLIFSIYNRIYNKN
ncbi:MFS transporter [Bacillus thuringiensis]|uniref:MFS transporter n=1 Tax=Bacillus thuringiensis TaxID=1428 RepID=A0A9X6KD40_BACTU|nr:MULTISPECIES: MFS transporter [Bacillus cereus group]MDA2615431.1 MFS transporter [Bacillus cereus]MEB8554633.1 MFS transporter [Bacillus cereus]MEB8728119.1 MFS transporter [Bacillus cereus]MEB8820391.1 MFS transporter [Bacillus cereus]MEB8975607.1 MFS transporter [Bacillus cereus]